MGKQEGSIDKVELIKERLHKEFEAEVAKGLDPAYSAFILRRDEDGEYITHMAETLWRGYYMRAIQINDRTASPANPFSMGK